MKKQNTFRMILVCALVLVVLVANANQASASVNPAPKTKTPTPTVATSTPSAPTPTPGPTKTPGPPQTVSSTELTSGFSLKSANNVTDPGTTISMVGYNVTSWYPITVPSTVMAGFFPHKVYLKAFFRTHPQTLPPFTKQNRGDRG